MQIIQDDGTQRDLEQYELDALTAAKDAHDAMQAANGVFQQWDEATSTKALLAIVANSVDIPIEKAVHMRSVYPDWSGDGVYYYLNDRVSYMDALWRCLQPHTSQEDWSPITAPSLWSKILISDVSDDATLPEWEQPSSTNPYNQGDRVTHDGKTWVSLVANNVWEPGAQGTSSIWQEVKE